MYVSGTELGLLHNSDYFLHFCLSQTSPRSVLVGTTAAVSVPQPLASSTQPLAGRAWQRGGSTPCLQPAGSQSSLLLGAGKSSISTHGRSFPWCLTLGAHSRKPSQGQRSAYSWHECDQMPDPKCLPESVKTLVKKLLGSFIYFP